MRLGMVETSAGLRVVSVVESEGTVRFVDLRAVDVSLPECLKAVLAQDDGLTRAAAASDAGLAQGRFVEGRLLAPILQPGKIICIGLNYRDHAEESGMDIPSEPVCFSKFSHTVIGTNEEVRLPAAATQCDYEAEMVAVIGRPGKNIPESEARSYVAGYMNGNDVSARDWQLGRPGGQWLLGKTPDTFAPTGPYLVTADEIPDPHALSIELRLNGETMQRSSTSEFIFTVDQLIAHLSRLITLEPGDMIFTGTPPGVGMARKPPVFLKPGDVLEVEVEHLGVLRNPVVSE